MITQGDTRKKALDNAADALAEAVAGLMRRGDDVPASDAFAKGTVELVMKQFIGGAVLDAAPELRRFCQ
jgi:hypothetical protein